MIATASLLKMSFRCISCSLVQLPGSAGGRGSLCMPAITYGKGMETLPVLYDALKSKRVFDTEMAFWPSRIRKFYDCKMLSLKVMVYAGERVDLETELAFNKLKDIEVETKGRYGVARCIVWPDCNVESPFTDKLQGLSFTLDRKGKMSGEFNFHPVLVNEQAVQLLKGLRLDGVSMRIGEFVTPPVNVKFTKVDGHTVLWEKC